MAETVDPTSSGTREAREDSASVMTGEAFIQGVANLTEGFACLAYLLREEADHPELVKHYTDMLDTRVAALSVLIFEARNWAR